MLGFVACLLVLDVLKHQSCFLKRLDSDLMCVTSTLTSCSVSTCFHQVTCRVIVFSSPVGMVEPGAGRVARALPASCQWRVSLAADCRASLIES